MADPSLIERLRLANHALANAPMVHVANHEGMFKPVDAMLEFQSATQAVIAAQASALEDQARLIGECRSVMVAVMQERRGYFGLVDALLTKLNAFGERDE